MTGALHLPSRAGPRPNATSDFPHSQLDQQPTDGEHVDTILAEALTWPGVLVGPSTVSVEGARALLLGEGVAAGLPDAFTAKREFCHVHSNGDYSLHAMLPIPLAEAAEQAGWAEPHFLVPLGKAPANLVMVYAPRDGREREVVLGLVRASYEFACLEIADSFRPESAVAAERD